jgi:membrane-associated protease RseP (regulator of RpoE activity)
LAFSQQEICCRGNLRSQNYKYAYDTINQNLQKIFGDRFLCYLQETPLENFGTGFGEAQNESTNSANYCFYLIPKQNTASPNRFGWIASSFSIIITSITILAVSANIHRFADISLINLQQGMPYLSGLASIFIARAIAQYIVIKQHRLKFTPHFLLPFLLPCIGGFGILGSLATNTHQNFHNVVKSTNPATQRRILFDLAAIPTIAGLAISIILLILGNWLFIPETQLIADSTIANPPISPLQMLPNLNTFDFKNSILANLGQSILQKIFSIDKSVIAPDTIPAFSPLTLAGWTGFALSALQLMPFDFLDGGNLAIAMFGYRQAVQIARITRIVLLAIALLAQPWLRIYSLLLFLLPTPSPLVLNETTEIGRSRDLIGMGLIAIALLILLPAPKSLL